MKIPATARLLALLGLCMFAVPIMGAGSDCPKKCVVEHADCAPTCGEPVTAGTCIDDNGSLICHRDHED